jgi:hypothetical protein
MTNDYEGNIPPVMQSFMTHIKELSVRLASDEEESLASFWIDLDILNPHPFLSTQLNRARPCFFRKCDTPLFPL